MRSIDQARSDARPLIGLTCCTKQILGSDFHAVLDRYIAAVSQFLDAAPVLIPVDGKPHHLEKLIERLDGVLVTGAPTMLHPSLYDEATEPEHKYDPLRDVTTQTLIPLAVCSGVPVLAICRGIQDMNVAFGGTLHQTLHRIAGKLDHRAPVDVATRADKFVPSHTINCVDGTLINTIAHACGLDPAKVPVNSLHVQAIKTLGKDLVAEAFAPDGTIEAIRAVKAQSFAYGVQWHAEWEPEKDGFNSALLHAFHNACQIRATSRLDGAIGIAASRGDAVDRTWQEVTN